MSTRADALFAALLFLLLGFQETTADCSNVTQFSLQVDSLLAEYDRETIPSTRVVVGLALDVRHANVNELTSTVRLLADLKMSWEDTRLSWNATDWGCDSALVSAERLWLPDVTLISAATSGMEGDMGQRAKLTSSGRVSWISRLDLSTPIALRLDNWPQDLHQAIFKFASRDHDSGELNLTINKLDQVSVFESGAWELVSVTRTEATWRDRQVAVWAVSLQRRAPAHAHAATAVLLTTALLLLAASALSPAHRFPLYACASLTAVLWLTSTLVRLPGSVTAPKMLALMGTLCVSGACACVAAACVVRLASVSAAPPRPLRTLLSATSALCKLTPPEGTSEGGSGAWAAAAQLLDYALLAALVLTVFVVLCLHL